MHLRLQRQRRGHGTVPLKIMPQTTSSPLLETTGGAGAGAATAHTTRRAFSKKCLLWVVLLVQICFICCFWLLQLDLSGNALSDGPLADGEIRTEGLIPTTDSSSNDVKKGVQRVNFIKKAAIALFEELRLPQPAHAVYRQRTANNAHALRRENVSKFSKEFLLKPNRLNNSNDEEISIMDMPRSEDVNTQIWCFREGTTNKSNIANSDEEDALQWNDIDEQCECETNWHGKDCGQPEVIWRALMTTKAYFQLQNPSKDEAHRLFHMLEGHFFSLDLLELLIKAVDEVVDYFFIFYRNSSAKHKEFTTLEHKLRQILPVGKYMIFHCSYLTRTGAHNSNDSCTTAHAYKYFRKNLYTVPLKPTDLFLYTNDREVLSSHALKFLKYYAADVHFVRFRLKYTVYGFYWQHPAQTYLTGLISSFTCLDSPHLGNADPMQLLASATSSDSKALIIGDLNHFGGWFCKYCQQPDEIIAELHAELSSLRHVQFPNVTRNRNIDAAYLQKLIATGVYVDGRTQLLKLRRYADKYYAPPYAEQNAWKFGNFLVNLFESLEEDNDDNEAYAK